MSIVVAHRGLSAMAPENTHAAFDMAWAHDSAAIELDVQVSADGEVLVCHDESLLRTAGIDKTIASLTLSELMQLDVGVWFDKRFAGEKLPLLEDVLKAMPVGKLIQVEVKPEVTNIDPIINILSRVRTDIQVYVMCFDDEVLARLQKGLPHLPMLLLREETDGSLADAIALARKRGYAGLDVDKVMITDASAVVQVHEADLLLGAWTVNDTKQVQQFYDWGVDMIASDAFHPEVQHA